jgi:hypothetical protein
MSSFKSTAIILALGAAFSSSAFAAGNTWDSATPWGSATTAQYAEWNTFDSATSDTTPDIGSGASLSVSPAGGFLFSGNIYTFNSVPAFTVNLAGVIGDVFDVYLRVATQGNTLLSTATLNGVSASSVLAYTGASDLGSGSEQELYWVWNNVTGASTYAFTFTASAPHLLLDQVSVATVAAVPEPSTYGMLALGLGVVGMIARRKRNNKQLA